MTDQHRHLHTELTQTSWRERFKGAIGSIAVGLLLALMGVAMLFWNEGRAVATARSLDQGAAIVRSIPASSVDAANDAELVHVSAPARTDERLRDDTFGISANALRVRRVVEMYQWHEQRESRTEKKVGGGSEMVTRYSCSTGWSERPIDWSAFKQRAGHTNPASTTFAGVTLRSTS